MPLPNESDKHFLDESDEESDEELCTFRDERLLHRKMGDLAVTQILYPNQCTPVKIHPSCSIREYLHALYENVLSEYWGFLMSRYNKVSGWQMHLLEQWNITWKQEKILKIETKQKRQINLDDCVYHLIVSCGRLCLTTKTPMPSKKDITKRKIIAHETIETLRLEEGRLLDTLGFQNVLPQEKEIAFSLGYVKPFIEELAVLIQYIENPMSCPQFLKAVADIRQRTSFQYENRTKAKGVESNEDQESVIRNLKYNVEAVQGPPGFILCCKLLTFGIHI